MWFAYFQPIIPANPLAPQTAALLPHVHRAGRRGPTDAGEYASALSDVTGGGHVTAAIEATGAGGRGCMGHVFTLTLNFRSIATLRHAYDSRHCMYVVERVGFLVPFANLHRMDGGRCI